MHVPYARIGSISQEIIGGMASPACDSQVHYITILCILHPNRQPTRKSRCRKIRDRREVCQIQGVYEEIDEGDHMHVMSHTVRVGVQLGTGCSIGVSPQPSVLPAPLCVFMCINGQG